MIVLKTTEFNVPCTMEAEVELAGLVRSALMLIMLDEGQIVE